MLPKRGSAYDLAIAIAIMAANGDLPARAEGIMFLAELGLDGRLRPVPAVLPAVLAAARAEITTIVVATANQAEAGLVPGLTVIAADSLSEVVAWLRAGPPPHREPPAPAAATAPVPPPPQPDLEDVLGQAAARRALEVCAAGTTCRSSDRRGQAPRYPNYNRYDVTARSGDSPAMNWADALPRIVRQGRASVRCPAIGGGS